MALKFLSSAGAFLTFAIVNYLPSFSISGLANMEYFVNVNIFLNVNKNVSGNYFFFLNIFVYSMILNISLILFHNVEFELIQLISQDRTVVSDFNL